LFTDLSTENGDRQFACRGTAIGEKMEDIFV
jgi:hypothetical protein